eukprot:380725-Prorocentrum_minimum.AAC.5
MARRGEKCGQRKRPVWQPAGGRARHGHVASANNRGENPILQWFYERRLKGFTDNAHLWHFFSIRNYLGGASNYPVVE